MSREQWGHGYHKGVEDGRRGLVEGMEGWNREEIELIMEYCIAKMYYRRHVLVGHDDMQDISAYPVKWFYNDFGDGDKIPKSILDFIYEYILKFRPYNTQITGPRGDKNIEEDDIRVYCYLPNGVRGYEEWCDDVTARMRPIFDKIDTLWWKQAGITQA